MACDICGVTGRPLIDLSDAYKTPDIQQICPGCEVIVNRQHGKLRTLTNKICATLLKRFMSERRKP